MNNALIRERAKKICPFSDFSSAESLSRHKGSNEGRKKERKRERKKEMERGEEAKR